MSVKRTPPMRIAPLQRIVAEEITDPAEIAAIDKMRMRLRAKKKGRKKQQRHWPKRNRKPRACAHATKTAKR